MEFIQWVLQSKSLVLSQQVQVSASLNDLIVTGAYLLVILITPNRQLRLSFLCLLICIILSNSAVFDVLEGFQVHLAYSIPYLFTVKYIKRAWPMLAVVAMAVFNIVMATDAYVYSETETWLYLNYSICTAILHCIIIISCIEWGGIIKKLDDSVNYLRCRLTGSSRILHWRGLRWYNKERKNH